MFAALLFCLLSASAQEGDSCEMRVNPARTTECAWNDVDSVHQESLGGGGHTTEACLARCLELGTACNYAAVSGSGYCHMFQTCDGSAGGSWVMYEKSCPDLVFSQVAAPGNCLSSHLNDIGLVIGNAPHTIQVQLTFPQSTSSQRQWILNLGQSAPGSQHWLWYPSNEVVQIGAWGGAQINGVDITQCTDLSTTYSGSVLKLYCNGVFMSEKQVGLDITHPNLAIGDSGLHLVHEDNFAGCISEVKVWSLEKSAEEIAQQTHPAFWKSCRWETVQDPNLANNVDTKDYFGYSCAHNEILTGFGLSAKKNDVTKVQCCELGGHSSVIPNSCSFIDASHPVTGQTQGFQPDVAICDANAHMVFSGAYDKEVAPGDEITELLAGKCCEVECNAQWCAGQDWGVNSDRCKILSVHPDDYKGEKKLVCPHGTLMTEIKDGFAGGAHGLQHISSIVCCELDLVAPPTKAPSTMPTTRPSTAPTATPTKAPSAMPTTSPSTAPTTAPSPMPTPAPTSTTECLRELQQAKLTLAQFLEGIKRCLPWCEVDQYTYGRAH